MGYTEYNPETLKHLQSLLIEMLGDLAYVCEKHDIDYFGGGGTAIGALRHKGIIPWDDDIDISFHMKDRDRLINAVLEEFGNKYWFGSPELEKGFPYIPLHMCRSGTIFMESVYDSKEFNSGIFLDLYPYSSVFKDPKKARKQILGAWFWGKMYVLYFASSPVLYISGFKEKVVRLGCKMVNKIMHLSHVDPMCFYRKAMSHCTACDREGATSDSIGWFFDPSPFTSILKNDDVYPTRFLEFNNMQIRFPNNVEKYLEQRYGDYMTLPPEDKRHNHPPFILKFSSKDTGSGHDLSQEG